MDKDNTLLLGSDKIWVCSSQFTYIYYRQFNRYNTDLKEY